MLNQRRTKVGDGALRGLSALDELVADEEIGTRRATVSSTRARRERVADTRRRVAGRYALAQSNYVACAKMIENVDKIIADAQELMQASGTELLAPVIEQATTMKETLVGVLQDMTQLDAVDEAFAQPGAGPMQEGKPVMPTKAKPVMPVARRRAIVGLDDTSEDARATQDKITQVTPGPSSSQASRLRVHADKVDDAIKEFVGRFNAEPEKYEMGPGGGWDALLQEVADKHGVGPGDIEYPLISGAARRKQAGGWGRFSEDTADALEGAVMQAMHQNLTDVESIVHFLESEYDQLIIGEGIGGDELRRFVVDTMALHGDGNTATRRRRKSGAVDASALGKQVRVNVPGESDDGRVGTAMTIEGDNSFRVRFQDEPGASVSFLFSELELTEGRQAARRRVRADTFQPGDDIYFLQMDEGTGATILAPGTVVKDLGDRVTIDPSDGSSRINKLKDYVSRPGSGGAGGVGYAWDHPEEPAVGAKVQFLDRDGTERLGEVTAVNLDGSFAVLASDGTRHQTDWVEAADTEADAFQDELIPSDGR